MTIKVKQKASTLVYATKVEVTIPLEEQTIKSKVSAENFFNSILHNVGDVKTTNGAIIYMKKLSTLVLQEFDIPNMFYLPMLEDNHIRLIGYDAVVTEEGDHVEFAESECGEILIVVTKGDFEIEANI